MKHLFTLLIVLFAFNGSQAQSIEIQVEGVEIVSIIPGPPSHFRFTGQIEVTGYEPFQEYPSWISLRSAPINDPEDFQVNVISQLDEDPNNPGHFLFTKDIPLYHYEGHEEILMGSQVEWFDFTGEVTVLVDSAISEMSPFQLMTVTSVTDQDKPELSVYPNPAQDIMTVLGLDIDEQIFVYDQFGRLISDQQPNSRGQIDLSNYSSGFYTIVVTSEKQTRSLKFIKI